ncbi:MAG: 2-phospho-L-lactate transferase [Candidatus Microbacterium colombiense]|nr:MAG: 2-phospho-L-lactate transferase [Microbacterium sp.]
MMSASDAPRIVVLAGGVGGSKFVLGVREAARRRWPDGAGGCRARITVIANTGDDVWLSGLRLQPDVDSMIYALAGVNDTERGWGRTGESERVAAELHAWGAGWPWFTLGDLDLGAHIARTGWLRDGASVTEVVGRLASRWPLGIRLLPMTDAEVDTHVITDQGRMHFQEWWTRHRASLPARSFESPGIADAAPAPGVREALAEADVILFAPSNPVVSLGPILAVPGIAEAVRTAQGAVVGVSPIIAGAPVRGMADACLAAVGIPATADAVGRHYGSRCSGLLDSPSTASEIATSTPPHPSPARRAADELRSRARGGLLDVWLMAEEDAALAASVEEAGLRAEVHPLWMRDLETSAALADAALDATALRA